MKWRMSEKAKKRQRYSRRTLAGHSKAKRSDEEKIVERGGERIVEPDERGGTNGSLICEFQYTERATPVSRSARASAFPPS